MAQIFASEKSAPASQPPARKKEALRDTAPEQALAQLQARADESGPTSRLSQLQAKGTLPLQRQEEEEMQMKPLQRMEEEEALQGKMIQRVEEEEALQGKFSTQAIQRQEASAGNGGLPSGLQQGIESLSGSDVSDVRVHYNSGAPAQVGAHAYAQGNDIHLASGQEKHLPHEAWHVVQQRQGRVQPTMDIGGTPVNDDPSLEKEADVMGSRASQMMSKDSAV